MSSPARTPMVQKLFAIIMQFANWRMVPAARFCDVHQHGRIHV
jgi:hypothetical protein